MARTQTEMLSIMPASGRDFFPINRLHSLGYGTPPTEIYTGFTGIFTKGRSSLAGILKESVNSNPALWPSLRAFSTRSTKHTFCFWLNSFGVK